jgi:hypothetical protein
MGIAGVRLCRMRWTESLRDENFKALADEFPGMYPSSCATCRLTQGIRPSALVTTMASGDASKRFSKKVWVSEAFGGMGEGPLIGLQVKGEVDGFRLF